MVELTQEQIEALQNGEEVEIEIEVWRGYDNPYTTMETRILTMAEDGDE